MKILILFYCALAAASAAYYGPQHIPVIGPNGVPVEPLEVQQARAEHLAALSSHGVPVHVPYAAPVTYSALSHAAYRAVPALGHNSLPLDTPEVANAKLQHYRDFATAAQRNGVHVTIPAPHHIAGPYPVDTPEVQQAKAAHLAAHAEAAARAGPASYYGHYRRYRCFQITRFINNPTNACAKQLMILYWDPRKRAIYGGYHIPVIGPNGVPVEPAEVQQARAAHLAALSAASHAGSASGEYRAAAYSAPEDYDHRRYYGPYAEIGHDGQPKETEAVRAAKAYHFAAYSAALSGNHLAGPHNYY